MFDRLVGTLRVGSPEPCLTFDLVHGGELPLPRVVEGVRRHGLEVGRVVPRGGRRAVAALAHARVVAQATFLEVRVR